MIMENLIPRGGRQKKTNVQTVALHFGLEQLRANANEGSPRDKGRPLFLKETITFIFS